MKGVTDSKKKGMSDIAHGFTPSTSNERMNVGIRGLHKRTHETSMQKQEIRENARGGYLKKAPQTRPISNTVLSKDVNVTAKATPKRCFRDDRKHALGTEPGIKIEPHSSMLCKLLGKQAPNGQRG